MKAFLRCLFDNPAKRFHRLTHPIAVVAHSPDSIILQDHFKHTEVFVKSEPVGCALLFAYKTGDILTIPR
ncbi:hypothetical protein F0P96_10455 [Hymenobacter busanensis]|uniref:Uncharacterized protein n=1 Tax=Hymenobacter busanensis TaxID=2607656 RepID=A0A7L4ZWR2_9BACT|nr:hypothetical protein [Hymenobacter busanensis]KAA9333381.1 hypothetical protein F0P96_10455 [Hymenobacter busanensis]QHJ07939.1 hypothetical protein GUY19_11850 [Hymenobacter busanensis]